MKIKAAVIREKGVYPQIEEIVIPGIEGGISGEVKYSAMNHRDLWIVKGQYAGITYPMVLGSDACISAKGKRYLINPGIGWGPDESCQSRSFEILGLPRFGTFAEKVIIEPEYLHDKPEHLTEIEAAALPLAGVTAYRALFARAECLPGEKVFISGIGGGVALMAMQFAIAHGCEVYVSSSDKDKIAKALNMGASGGFNYLDEEMSRKVLKEAGKMDVIIDSAGGEGFNQLVSIAGPGSRIVLYGGTRGNISISPQKLFWSQLSILGSTMGSESDFAQMLKFVERHKIRPHIEHVFDIRDIASAFSLMDSGRQFGKIVLKNEF